MTNAYLYGEGAEVPEIPEDIIMCRVETLKEHLKELLDHSYYTRDEVKVRVVLKAIDFWESINKKEV